MRKLWLILFAVLAILINPACIRAEQNRNRKEDEYSAGDILSLHSKAAALYDAENGRLLYGKNEDEMLPMASTTKIMTCLVALENGDEKQKCMVSARASSSPQVRMGVKKGEEYYLSDLLYALMLESYNDAAVVIAENIAGSVEEFAALMNEKAMEIGASHTYFVTPNGLDADGHETTAADLALIMSCCIKNEDFINITSEKEYDFSDVSGKRSFHLNNHNALLSMMDGMISGKTGFTGNAGYCYVGAYEKDGKTLTFSLLGCGWPPEKTAKWKDSRKLIDYAVNEFKEQNLLYAGQVLPPVPVEEGIRGAVQLYYRDGVTCLLGPDDTYRFRYNYPKKLHAPVVANTSIGSVDIYVNDNYYDSSTVYAMEGDERKNILIYAERIVNVFLL